MNILETVETCLDEAGAILMKHHGKCEISEKSSAINLVTVADGEAEGAIKKVISSRFPDHQILAEETGEDYHGKSSGYRWIIDPLDGTTNYSHSMSIFSTSIAVEKDGTVIAAGVQNPYYRERFLAEKGAGATFNGSPIHVSKVEQLSKSLLVTGFPYDRRQHMPHYLFYMGEFLMRAHGVIRLGSAALDLCCVACGRLEGFWEEKLSAWDIAAGALIVEEAGGRVTDYSNQEFSPYGVEILATNGKIHDECVEVLALPSS